MDDWTALEGRIQENLANAPNVVTLNVGGTTFQTSKSTLLRVDGSYFHALLGSGLWHPDSHDKAYFLDLDPVIFRHVLNFLRTGKLSIDGLTKGDRDVLKATAAYLNLNVWGKWSEWNPHSLPRNVSLFNDNCTLQWVQMPGECVAFATNPLGVIRIRIDDGRATFGAGPTTGPHAWKMKYSKFFSPTGFGSAGCSYPKVVTIRRHPTHVDFSSDDGPPFSVIVDDVTEELFPAVTIGNDGKLTILTS